MSEELQTLLTNYSKNYSLITPITELVKQAYNLGASERQEFDANMVDDNTSDCSDENYLEVPVNICEIIRETPFTN